MVDHLQAERFSFLESFVTLYGFQSLCDFTTEVSLKELQKKSPTFLEQVNKQMDMIKNLFPMSLFNLKRKEYVIDSENLALKVLRHCLEITNIPYQHVHQQKGNVLRLNPPNLIYMKYIIHQQENQKNLTKEMSSITQEMNEFIHGYDLKQLETFFEKGTLSVSDLKKKMVMRPVVDEILPISREDLHLPPDNKVLVLPPVHYHNRQYQLFDYLNEFCVINSIVCHYPVGSLGGMVELSDGRHDLVVIHDAIWKLEEGEIELTHGLCSYQHPLPMSIFYNLAGLLKLRISCDGEGYDQIRVNYTEITQIDLPLFKKLFGSDLQIPIEQTLSEQTSFDPKQGTQQVIPFYLNTINPWITEIKCYAVSKEKGRYQALIKRVDLSIDSVQVEIQVESQAEPGTFRFIFTGHRLKYDHIKITFNVFLSREISESDMFIYQCQCPEVLKGKPEFKP